MRSAGMGDSMGEEVVRYRLGRIKPFDVLTFPLPAEETRRRLRSAFTYAESLATGGFFKGVADGVGAGLIVLSARGISYGSTPWRCCFWGYEEKDLLGRSPDSIIDSNDTAHDLDPGKRRSFTSRMIRRDGSLFWAGCFTGNIRLPEGAGLVLVFNDVSEKKAREDELLLSAKVFECSGEAIMITDMEDKILAVNESLWK